jgi:hypothetical protein
MIRVERSPGDNLRLLALLVSGLAFDQVTLPDNALVVAERAALVHHLMRLVLLVTQG